MNWPEKVTIKEVGPRDGLQNEKVMIPAKSKMVDPEYFSIKNDAIEEIILDNGKLRLLAGNYKDYKGYQSKYLPLDYYDIHLDPNSTFSISVENERSIMVFTLVGEVYIDDELIKEKTAVKLTEGDNVQLKTKDKNAQILFISSERLDEPIVWGGPIVMNTKEELQQAFNEVRQGTFLKKGISY